MNGNLQMIITSRSRDLGGFNVRRILPYATHRMVGPFIFFDHMGPAEFPPGEGLDVRPHPHINLATVTYLFDGAILHRDSLGSEQLIEPGAINWMTAGRGIVHSERSPQGLRKTGHRLHGIQCWVALPQAYEEIEPSFKHHPAASLPAWSENGVQLKLLLGSAFGKQSPVRTHSDIVYMEAIFPAGSELMLSSEGRRDLAAYVVEGAIHANGEKLEDTSMAVGHAKSDLHLRAVRDSRVMLLGGEALHGNRYIYWNFVSSSQERIEKAKADWSAGRFGKIPGDDREFIPLPDEPGVPKGTIL